MDKLLLIKAFGAFFAVMNPFVNLPIFLALTNGFSVADQRSLSIKITIYAAAMCAVLLIGGQQIIGFFGITIDQFRIAGGLVLAHIAWSMLNGSNIDSHQGSEDEQDKITNLQDLAFYPITFPMIVGPGTIATIIIYTGQVDGLKGMLSIGAVLAVILFMLFLVMFFASMFAKVLTDTMRAIMTRLMGMILLAIAVEMIVDGAKVVWPGLA